ncbi:DNA repair protein RecN [Occallatibacter riparius]|uniref:DNA repair protein RecN n=1 Tax=Occallatibacter riparius TaxID=1002689 RepID=A0A9J7BH79_9BACT|nr:DNA repair protein RecN [Occallatibacter riparius]UWZ81873.1 DNA repair protein RecN [Occallatibacter riparius]
MLIELRAENYAVIDHAIAVFGPGLNLLTGETGAGKSILVDALALLMGGKSSAEVIRHGADRAVVSCVFEATAGAEAILEENGIDVEGTEVILRREILTSGKGRVFVNNQPATVAVLKQLAPELALVHAQTETLVSFDQGQQRHLLDRFAGISLEAVNEAYTKWKQASDKLADLLEGEQDRLRMVDLWTYQSKEIDAAKLEPEEDEALETEKRVLANAEKLYAAAMGAFDQLYEGGISVEVCLRAAIKHVEELARYDGKFNESVQQLKSAGAIVDDVATSLRDYAEGINASPDRLAEIEDRLAIIDRLKRKYGKTVAEILAFSEDVARKLSEVEDRDEILKTLRAEVDRTAAEYRKAAAALSIERKAAAARLAKQAEAQINSLAMKVRFEIEVAANEEEQNWSAAGWDEVEYRIATNAGEPLKPLHEIASGGEMSRVMLALKVAVEETTSKNKRKTPTPRTLVFDEIDIGIGGRAAEAVGQKLKALSRGQQILCVTHLPQIAAFADQHFLIDKRESGGRTKTQIRLLDQRQSTHEVARMLSGATVTETSLQHAAQMIAASK